MDSFSELNLNESLKHSIARMHFKIPTPIQAQAIPPALLGKDIWVQRKLVREKHFVMELLVLINF